MGWQCAEQAHAVRVRKARYCEWCYRTWPVGSRVYTWSGFLDGGAIRVYMCVICYDYMCSCPSGTFDDELPSEAFWTEDFAEYREFDCRHGLYLIAKGLPTVVELREQQQLKWKDRRILLSQSQKT